MPNKPADKKTKFNKKHETYDLPFCNCLMLLLFLRDFHITAIVIISLPALLAHYFLVVNTNVFMSLTVYCTMLLSRRHTKIHRPTYLCIPIHIYL